MPSLFKALTTTFFVMSAVILSICFMEIADDNLPQNELLLFGVMVFVGITGCISAAVILTTNNSKG